MIIFHYYYHYVTIMIVIIDSMTPSFMRCVCFMKIDYLENKYSEFD